VEQFQTSKNEKKRSAREASGVLGKYQIKRVARRLQEKLLFFAGWRLKKSGGLIPSDL